MFISNIHYAIVNPFDIRYVQDDLHVIAFFVEHPSYEAVEAMISFRDGGGLAIRAILTKHDQTQVDHINDAQMLSAASASGRTSVFRDIDASLDVATTLPSATIRFRSYLDEAVVLTLKCASTPDSKRGGITDPGQHASKSSFPVMLRGKSAMASPASTVEISATTYKIPEKIRISDYFVGHNGYFTLHHQMAVLRSGTQDVTVLRSPHSISNGQKWVYDTTSGLKTYTIGSVASSGHFEIQSDGQNIEQILAEYVDEKLFIQKIRLGGKSERSEGFSLSFQRDKTFSVDIDGFENAVSGRFEQTQSHELILLPLMPLWAEARPIKVRFSRFEKRFNIATTIGGSQ